MSLRLKSKHGKMDISRGKERRAILGYGEVGFSVGGSCSAELENDIWLDGRVLHFYTRNQGWQIVEHIGAGTNPDRHSVCSTRHNLVLFERRMAHDISHKLICPNR